jgi:hypothetical protein
MFQNLKTKAASSSKVLVPSLNHTPKDHNLDLQLFVHAKPYFNTAKIGPDNVM